MGDLLTSGVQEILTQALILVAKQIIASREFKKVLEDLKSELVRAEWILNAIRTKHDHSHKDIITNWVNDLQLIVYEAEDMLDLFVYEDVDREKRSNKVFPNSLCTIKPVLDYFSMLVFGSTRTKKMKGIIDVLSQHCTKLVQLVQLDDTTAKIESEVMQIEETISTLENYVVGRKMEVESIVKGVIEASQQQRNSILPVYGMGGSGKTTLAHLVFNDKRIREHFQHTVWISVSQPFVINEILHSFLQNVHKDKNHSKDNRETLIQKLKEVMGGRRYFLVLDNVWNENKSLWEKLKESLMSIVEELGNSVLVTTRSREIAEMMRENFDSHQLNELNDDQCWSVFSHFAKANELQMTSDLAVVREEVVKKIGGLPLLARVLGGAAQFSGDSEKWVENLKSFLTTSLENEKLSVKFILKLSVDRLPKASIKQCFAYCSNFPKGYRFDKKQLIQMWMAHGFTRPDKERNETMEDTGERYFNILLSYCLFQDVEVDDWIGKKFLMHDLIHDIACDISSDKKLQLDHSSSSEWKPLTKENKIIASKLRTVVDFGRNGKIGDFECLRVLTITKEDLRGFARSLYKLKHLRYLDLSCCSVLAELPKSIVLLYNLQTLKLYCIGDGLPPTNLRRMVSLRHLECRIKHEYLYPEFDMPPYLSELVQLQTLFAFEVGFKKGCKITELGGLRNLKGLLMLHRLERVESKEEAKATKLVEKEKVEELHLVWTRKSHRIVGYQNDLEVLEGLEPHKNLKYLEIQSFLGGRLPKETFVENLVKITLTKCRNCEKLPMLGQLNNLELLAISAFGKVKSIGIEFYGNYNDGQSKSSVAVFPKLKEFVVHTMYSLVEWEEVGKNVKAFPRLEYLGIGRCPILDKIPDVFGYCDEDGEKHLKFVDIRFCDRLMELPKGIQSCNLGR